MSVRASLETGTMELAGLNRQAKANDRTNNAKHSLDERREAADSNFRNSLRAHFEVPDSEDVGRKAVDRDAIPRQAAMDSSENGDLKRGSATSTADDVRPAQRVANKMHLDGRAQLIVPAGMQKRFSIVKEHQSLGVAAGGNLKKSALGESTSNRPNGSDATTDVVAFLSPAVAITSPRPGDPTCALPVFSSEVTANGRVTSVLQENIPAATSPSLNSRVRSEEQIASNARLFSSSDIQSAVTQEGESAFVIGTNNAALGESEADGEVTSQVRSTELSIRENMPSQRLLEPAGKSEPLGELASSDYFDQDTGVTRTPSISSRQAVATSQLQAISTAENRDTKAPSFQNLGSNLAQSPSGADSNEVIRDTNRSAETSFTAQSAGSTNALGSDAKSRSSSSRFAASSVQIHKQDPPSSSVVLASQSANHAPTAEATNTVSTPQKAIDAFSNYTRLQDTFTALESASGNETNSYHWTRTGPTQAEAGYLDPTLGWIAVRAESNGGVLHATLVPSSSDSAQALSGHMAGLHTYLVDNRTPVETLTLASFGGNVQQFAGQDSREGTHQRAGQQAEENKVPEPALELRSNGRSPQGAPQDGSISHPDFTRSISVGGNAGVHISVIA